MRKRISKPFAVFLAISALVHGGILGLTPARARPADNFRDQGPRVALVNIPLPSPPQKANPVRPAPSETPAPSMPEVPRETTPAHESADQPPDEAGASGALSYTNAALREDPLSRYLAMIRGRIDQRKVYPYQARQQEQEGTVVVRFTITRLGLLAGEPELEKRSRYASLNAAAIAAVKNAAPYPPLPGEAGSEMSFQVAVSFSLK
jgi:protein TonB